MNTQDFLFAIRNSYKSLRPSEQKVADFILQKALSSYEYIQAVKALERAKNISVYAVENSSSFVFPV